MPQAHKPTQEKPGNGKNALPISDTEKAPQNAPEGFSQDERFERRQARRMTPITKERRHHLDSHLTHALGAIRKLLTTRLTPAEMKLVEDFAILETEWVLSRPQNPPITNVSFGVLMAHCKQACADLETVKQERHASE
jgi:hypothetical protein